MAERKARVERNTLETQITVEINLDGTGQSSFDTGVPFLEHMMDQIARHGLVDLNIVAKGDLHIDDHHTVEDIGITLGQAFKQAVGDKKGIRRYGHAYVPLDEALSRVVIDLSGRPGLAMDVPYTRGAVGGFDVDLFEEHGFVNHSMVTLHIDNLKGKNTHHQIETVFKAFGRALRFAIEMDERMAGITHPQGCPVTVRKTGTTLLYENRCHNRLRHGQPAFCPQGRGTRCAGRTGAGHRQRRPDPRS